MAKKVIQTSKDKSAKDLYSDSVYNAPATTGSGKVEGTSDKPVGNNLTPSVNRTVKRKKPSTMQVLNDAFGTGVASKNSGSGDSGKDAEAVLSGIGSMPESIPAKNKGSANEIKQAKTETLENISKEEQAKKKLRETDEANSIKWSEEQKKKKLLPINVGSK